VRVVQRGSGIGDWGSRKGRAAVVRVALWTLATLWMGTVPAEAAQCSFSTSSVNFGTYNVFTSGPNDTVGTIRFECNGGAKHVVVAITSGTAGSFAPRSLGGGLDRLSYNLYQNASRTSIWGDGSAGSQPYYVGDPPNKQEQTLTIYARIPAAQDVRAGSYSDSVTVVVLY